MKSEQTIKKWIGDLQTTVNDDTAPLLDQRIAYFAANLLRRVTEDVKWESIADDLKMTARIIERDLENE